MENADVNTEGVGIRDARYLGQNHHSVYTDQNGVELVPERCILQGHPSLLQCPASTQNDRQKQLVDLVIARQFR
jgi:hypothetical protein